MLNDTQTPSDILVPASRIKPENLQTVSSFYKLMLPPPRVFRSDHDLLARMQVKCYNINLTDLTCLCVNSMGLVH